jgi:hypothetical protein
MDGSTVTCCRPFLLATGLVNPIQTVAMKHPENLCPLDRETRTALPTVEAARHLNRAQNTLRIWAMREDGPLRPLRIQGRLAWPVADLKRILGVA